MARLFTHHSLLDVVLLFGLGSLGPQNPKWEDFELRNPKWEVQTPKWEFETPKWENIKLQAPMWEAQLPIWLDSTKA